MKSNRVLRFVSKGILFFLCLNTGMLFSGCALRAYSEGSPSHALDHMWVYNEKGRFMPSPDCLCYAQFNVEPSGDWLSDIISLGKRYLGKPYRYHGHGFTFDCSGYMRFLFNSIGIHLSGSSADIAKVTKPIKNPVPGDLLFFKGRNSRSARIGHVALLVDITPNGDYLMLHSTNSNGIVLERMKSSLYFSKRYVGAGRIPLLSKDLEARIRATETLQLHSKPVPPAFDTPSPIIGKDQEMPIELRTPSVPIDRS